MLFNSFSFLIFFPVVYGLYLVLNRERQNRLLLAASGLFYAAWDWRFVLLMLASVGSSYLCARRITRSSDPRHRKALLVLSVTINLIFLGFFKYFDFFRENLAALLHTFGMGWHGGVLEVLLPVGISFYTFEAISYVCDVYRGVSKPARSFEEYALFIAYFPHLVAGPIMRAGDFLPQIQRDRTVTPDKLAEGAYLILWGYFQKVFVGDNLAPLVSGVFDAPGPHGGLRTLVGVYAFAFQIYCDFAGYSNIARGLGKCMGFEITLNFNLPYFSTNPPDFWRRWHISLSTWLRDYLYIPLGGNRLGVWMTCRNLMITMLLGGLWHGAAWTFVLWGAFHGLLLVGYRLLEPSLAGIRVPHNPVSLGAWRVLRTIGFFHLVCLGWMLFRAASVDQVGRMLQDIVLNFNFGDAAVWRDAVKPFVFFTAVLVGLEWAQFRKGDLLTVFKWPVAARVLVYLNCFYSIVIFGVNHAQSFIYFQF